MCEILEDQHTTKWKQRMGVLSMKLKKNPFRLVVCLFLFCCYFFSFFLGGGGSLLATSGAVSSAK